MKKTEFLATSQVAEQFNPIQLIILNGTIQNFFSKTGYDFYVLTPAGPTHSTLKASGYNLFNKKQIIADEKGQTLKIKFPIPRGQKLWAKVDDYGDKFVCTILFPEEY